MNTDKGRKVANHPDKELLPRQRADIDTCLLDVVIDYDLDHTKLKNDAELHGYMLPALQDRHPDWEGLEGNPGWKTGAKAYNQFHNALKNHLYK